MKWYEDPIYIKMCEKAEKIQNLAPRETNTDSKTYFEQHNFIVGVDGQVSPEDDGCYFGLTEEKQTWLPTQSQLQAMVLPDPDRKDAWGEPWPPDPKNDSVFWMFHDFAEAIQERKWSQQTAEQLWLRYAMHKKYNKTWDSEKEEWIEIKKAGVGG